MSCKLWLLFLQESLSIDTNAVNPSADNVCVCVGGGGGGGGGVLICSML